MKIYRKRFIPAEIVDISKDKVLFRSDDILITKWIPIHPRKDIGSGVSFYFLSEGIKVSKFLNEEGKFLYWYCDIIDYEYDFQREEYVFTDLLVDVKVYEDGTYEVLDLDEIVKAYKEKLITIDILCDALEKLNRLLKMIQRGEFPKEICKSFKEVLPC